MDKAYETSLTTLLEILEEGYGPYGRITLVQNKINGPVTLSRVSHKLLQNVVGDDPRVRLITTGIQSHGQSWVDGGCLLGIVAIKLVLSYYKLSTTVHPRLYCNVISWCLKFTLEQLQSIDKSRFSINIPCMIATIDSVLGAKLSLVSDASRAALCKSLTEVFILCEGKDVLSSVRFVKQRGSMEFNNTLYRGVLLDTHHAPLRLPAGNYRAILCTCSLSGDTDEGMDFSYESDRSYHITQVIMEKLEGLIQSLISLGVTLLVTQKVIHPKLKSLLHTQGIKYQERLGKELITSLIKMTRAEPIHSIQDKLTQTRVTDICCSHILRKGKTLTDRKNTSLLLTVTDSNICTIELSCWSDMLLDEIHGVCLQALTTLHRAIVSPELIPGAGNWQTFCADRLEKAACDQQTIHQMGASPGMFREIKTRFARIFRSNGALLTPERKLNIEGTTVRTESEVMDIKATTVRALTMAVSLAQAAVNVHQVMKLD